MKTIFENIRFLRKKHGYSQAQVAEFLDLDASGYGKLERGNTDITFSKIEKLAEFYGISVVELISYSNPEIINKNIESERISVTFEVSPDKRDILLNLITKKE